MVVNAVVAAGAPASAALARKGGEGWEALIRVGGKTLLESVVTSLAATAGVERVVVVAPAVVRNRLSGLEVEWLEARSTGYENMLAGVEAADPERPCLLCVADLPFAHQTDFGSFLSGCDPSYDVNYGITGQAEFQSVFPGCRRRFVPLTEGRFTGAGVGMVWPHTLLGARDHFKALFSSRKNTFRIAMRLGAIFLIKRAFGALTIPEVQARFSQVVGLRSQAVRGCDPRLTLDVDSERDLDYALEWAAGRVASL